MNFKKFVQAAATGMKFTLTGITSQLLEKTWVSNGNSWAVKVFMHICYFLCPDTAAVVKGVCGLSEIYVVLQIILVSKVQIHWAGREGQIDTMFLFCVFLGGRREISLFDYYTTTLCC